MPEATNSLINHNSSNNPTTILSLPSTTTSVPSSNSTSQTDNRTFKQRKSFVSRRDEVIGIRNKFPNKVPVIVERYQKEKSLPILDKTKFLVPQELIMSQFITIIRNRMSLNSSQAFYLIVNNRSIASMSMTLAEIYNEERDEDGFLYMTYASQEMFGRNTEEHLN